MEPARAGAPVHRAAAPGPFGGVKRQIGIRQPPQVAKHLGLAAIEVKDRVREVRRGPFHIELKQRIVGDRIENIDVIGDPEGSPDRFDE